MNNTYLDNKIKSYCNGCGACALICPKKCIKMIEDEEGFLYPQIDDKKCINCGKCRIFCSNNKVEQEKKERAFIAINKVEQQLKHSSSGGMFFILAEYIIKKNGVVFGVAYNEKLEVVHKYAETLSDCKKFCGSKYVRSNLQNSYELVKEFLNNERYVLFTGTACQINGLKKFLGKEYEKLLLCDVLCLANPSPKVFKTYIENLKKIKNKDVKNVYFRTKENGWKNQTPIIEYEDGEKMEENSYFRAFEFGLINRPSCHTCQFTSKTRISDFTIGDFWGIEKIDTNINYNNGVSLLTVNSDKGLQIFNEIKDKIQFKEIEYELACSFNHYHNVNENKNRDKFFEKFSKGNINENNIISLMKKYTRRPIYKKIFTALKIILKKVVKR